MAGGRRREMQMWNRLSLCCTLLLFAGAPAPALDEGSAVDASAGIDETGRVEIVPKTPGPHWVWVLDAALSSMPDGRAWLIDADQGKVMGSLNTGYSFQAFALPRAHGEIYSAETYYSRHTRGVRTDVVSVYDSSTLTPKAEIMLPPKRGSTIPRLNNSALTDDDRFMAVFNLTPATSLSIVDLRSRTLAGEINIPGCSSAFPTGARAYFSLCFNGSALLTQLQDDGTLARQTLLEKFFDPEADFIADHGARSADAWLFISAQGNVYSLDTSGATPVAGKPWPYLDDAERKDNWRMSGFQGSALHRGSGELFVLVHRGPPDSYKEFGTEVWVYDIASRARVRKIVLKQPAVAIEISRDQRPVLVSVNMQSREVDVYSASDGRHLRNIAEVGITPALLQFPWNGDSASH